MGSRARYLAEQEHFMRETLGWEPEPSRVAKMGERMAARYTTSLLRAGERMQPKVNLHHPKRNPVLHRRAQLRGKLVATGRKKADELAIDATPTIAPIRQTFFREDMPAATVRKNQPLKTHMQEKDAKRVVSQYGLAGELPKHLTREQRMGAYEARYISAGGRKGERWQRRAERSDKVKTAGLGVATLGGAGVLATRAKPIARLMGAKGKRIQSATDTTAIAGATVGGGAELDAARARRKRASYASAPGGVAASALRRMRAMDEARSR